MRTAKFDTIRIAEIKISLLEAPATIEAKAAFVDSAKGQTHGYTSCRQWSPETIEKLKELRACMEADLAAVHFVDSATSAPTTSGGEMRGAFQGLGEHLGSTDDPTPQG